MIDKMEYQEKKRIICLRKFKIPPLKTNKIFKKINEGLSQGGKIIILDVTAPSLEYAINYYASTHKNFCYTMAINDSPAFHCLL
jgi:hypothetical protein